MALMAVTTLVVTPVPLELAEKISRQVPPGPSAARPAPPLAVQQGPPPPLQAPNAVVGTLLLVASLSARASASGEVDVLTATNLAPAFLNSSCRLAMVGALNE